MLIKEFGTKKHCFYGAILLFACISMMSATELPLPAETNLEDETAVEMLPGIVDEEQPPSDINRPLRSKGQRLPARFAESRKHRTTEEVLPTIPGIDHALTQKWIARYSSKANLAWIAASLRSGEPYLDFIRAEVERRGLPPELVYLPVIESGFNAVARSRSGARGLWQFMRNSMAPYMRFDEWRDERLDFWKSTNAALSKLQMHFKEFDSWPMALAAYNSGGGAISRAIRTHNSKDYWHLAETQKLKTESIHYVPKLLAVYYIASNPRKFNLDICRPVAEFQWTQVEVSRQVSLPLLAEYAGIDAAVLRDANRGLITQVTPPGSTLLNVRVEDAAAIRAVLEQDELKLLKHVLYTIQPGDTLYAIGQNYGVTIQQLIIENPDLRPSALRPGTSISIPVGGGGGTLAQKPAKVQQDAVTKETDIPEALSWKGARTVRAGDTLWSIAREYNTSVAVLARANKMALSSTLSIGKVLSVP
ncbi:MAG: LysM peptidoglycan-binding domain-containing protein [Spirochaetaceae bacterium]|jgi:membrane-bound lytic murein transglycosylase D|nr:LysM peptidoglycan-binding domain-containing protein [Spirochaetaceae bacterium]